MKRSPLKRTGILSRRRKAPLYDPDKEAMREWKRGVHVCALCSRSQANGVTVDCHHVLAQRVIRRWVSGKIHEGVYDASERPLLLRKLLWDRRNRLPLCRPCHDAVERRQKTILRTLLGDAYEFAAELGLEWWLDRAYPQKRDCVVCDDAGCEFCPSVPKEAA